MMKTPRKMETSENGDLSGYFKSRDFENGGFPHVNTPKRYFTKTKSLRFRLTALLCKCRLKQAIPKRPLMAFRTPPNLRNLLVRANLHTLAPPTNAGNTACNNKQCKTCPIIVSGYTFASFITGRKYNIKAHIPCKSRNLVNLI